MNLLGQNFKINELFTRFSILYLPHSSQFKMDEMLLVVSVGLKFFSSCHHQRIRAKNLFFTLGDAESAH